MTQAELTTFGRHGGRIDDARRIYPHAPLPWIDLSTGVNPTPWASDRPIAFDPAPLPTASALVELEAAAARHFGADPARVAAVPGSEIALRLLRALGLPEPIIAFRPGYGTHGDVADATTTSIEAWNGAGTRLLANPNNPDGRVIAPAQLRELAGRGGWLVIDEAFADAMPDASVLPGLDDASPVIVLRSFGKFFGLAGLRLGFVVAPPGMIARVRALMGDWPIAAHTIAWASAAYADDAWIAAMRLSLRARAARLDAVLARHGLTAVGECPLFRLAIHPGASALFERLARAGILTRPFADRPDWLRFGLPGDDAAFDRLDRALARG